MKTSCLIVTLAFLSGALRGEEPPASSQFIDPALPAGQEPLEEGIQVDSVENSVLITDQAPIGENPYDSSLSASQARVNRQANAKGGQQAAFKRSKNKVKSTPQGNVISDSKELKLNQLFSIRGQKMRFQVTQELSNDEFFVFEVYGHGTIGIRFFASETDKKAFASHTIELNSAEGVLTIPIDGQFYGAKGFVYEIWNADAAKQPTFTLLFSQTDRVNVPFDTRGKILGRFAQYITVSVAMPGDKYVDGGDYRLQLIAQTSLERQQLTGHERFEMFINSGEKIPTENAHDMVAAGHSGTGLVKTVSKNNRFYCTGAACKFTVRMAVVNVDYVYLMPTVFRNGMDMAFDHYLYLLEELEAGEEVTYSFTVPKQEANWVFSMHPMEGTPEMFINPDTELASLKDAKYRAVSQNPENILITNFEAKQFGFSMEKFWVSFRSADPSQPSVLKFEIIKNSVEQRWFIREDVAETGVVARDEIVNYYLDLLSQNSQSFTFRLNLYSFSGSADFYVKECLPDEKDCRVTPEDLTYMKQNALELSENQERIMRYSAIDLEPGAVEKKDFIMLNFNCKRDGKKMPNQYPNSESCLFAVGIHCRDSHNPYGAFYRFDVRGEDVLVPLDFEGSKTLTLNKGQNIAYSFDLKSVEKDKNLVAGFRIIALTGRFKVFFSRRSIYPSESDHEMMISVDDVSFASLHSVEKDGAIVLFDDFMPEYLYMNVVATSYSVMDVFPYIYNAQSPDVEIQEAAQFNHQMHRKMNEDDIATVDGARMHVQNFLVTVPTLTDYAEPMIAHLTSDVLGFKLCAQVNVVMFDLKKPCDFFSDSEILEIPPQILRTLAGRKVGLSVQRPILGSSPDKNEIDFALTVNTEDLGSLLKINAPGRSYTYTSTNKFGVHLQIDLSGMKRSALISLTSDDPLMYAHVYTGQSSQENFAETLDKFKFAFNITDAAEYRKRHCTSSCVVQLEVLTTSSDQFRFTVTYTIDSTPITLKDGSNIILPASQALYLVHEPTDDKNPVSFNYLCEQTSVVAYGGIFPAGESSQKKIGSYLNENTFAFKSSIDVQNTMVIPRSMFSGKAQQIAVFLLVPKFDLDQPAERKGYLAYFHSADKMRVDVHSSMAKLDPFKHVTGTVGKGDFANYYFTLDHPQDFTVMLSVLAGEADLYLNKNMFNITTTKRFWQRAVNHRSDEIVVRKDMYSDVDGPLSFSVGVFGREKAKFSIMVVPEFKNLMSVTFQHLIEMELKKGEYYYFDFFNRNERYSTLLFSENSDIEVSALNFDERAMNTDFLYLVEDEKNYVQKFTFHKGDVPRKNLCDHAVELKTHVIVRVKPIEDNAHLIFLVYDAMKPISVFSERRFTFVQEKGDEHIFKVDLAGDYEHVEVDIKLSFGSIEVWLSDWEDTFKESTLISSPGQRYIKYTLDKSKRDNDIVIFDKLFIKVKTSEFSKFSIYARPENKFKEIRQFETELIYPNKDYDQFLFHFVSDKAVKTMKAFSIFLEFVNYYGDRPEMFYMPNMDVMIDKDSKMLAMPLVDFIERDKGDFHTIEVKPEIRSGYFIIKIKSSATSKVPIKVSLSINNHRNVELNGLYKGSVPSGHQTHSYSMYVPTAGEVRILAESCANIAPDQATFSNRKSTTVINFEDRYSQGFSYVHIDDTASPKTRNYKVLALPIRRAVIEDPGVLRFELGKNHHQDSQDLPGLANHYYLMTEFRPKEKELFFKDYVQLWDEAETINLRKFSYRFVENNKMLRVTTAIPKFKQQLLIDYPSLKKITVRLYVDLLSEENLEQKLEVCGMAILREVTTVRHSSERIVSASEISEKKDSGNFEVLFEASELEKFAEKDKLQLFSTLSVTFFDNENEEHHVTLNFKFASLPYFFATFANKTQTISTTSNVIFVIGFIIVILGLLALFFYITAKGANESPISEKRYTYTPAGTQSQSSLEMSQRSFN